jgi:hypothetical protein
MTAAGDWPDKKSRGDVSIPSDPFVGEVPVSLPAPHHHPIQEKPP